MSIIMGSVYRDIVSGFEGTCTGMLEWMYGCRQYTLQPKAENSSRKENSALFFEKQLEFVNEGISGKVEQPVIDDAVYFGKECRDKVTGVKGMCIGRGVWLFSSPQYVVEIQPEDTAKESRYLWLDEGRMERVENPEHEIDPADVTGDKPGGVFNESAYPPRNPLDL